MEKNDSARRFIEWAKHSRVPLVNFNPSVSLDDLAAFGRMVGDATIVAFSEGAHGTAEPLELRNRLLEYLVREKGFTAIAIESGILEGRAIHDYVRGGSGELQAVVKGITWGMDQFAKNGELIRWLTGYNGDPRHVRMVNFYGFDYPGGPSSSRTDWGYDIALNHVLDFLGNVDVRAAEAFRSRFEPYMSLQHHPRRPPEGPNYASLSQSERDTVTAAIVDLINWMELHEGNYIASATADGYTWAYRAAIGLRQMNDYLRAYPVGWMVSSTETVEIDERPDFFPIASDVRDRAQADNIEWIVQQEGPAGKILIFAARYHLSAAPLKVSWDPHRLRTEQFVAGTYLRRRFGAQYVAICHLIGRGEAAGHSLGQAPVESMDDLVREVGAPLFFLDLRKAPLQLKQWLNQEQQLVAGTQRIDLPLGEAFDILFYTDTVTPA